MAFVFLALASMAWAQIACASDGVEGERPAAAVPHDCSDKAQDKRGGGATVCIEGEIGPKTAQQVMAHKGRISRLVIHSEGGNAESAMAIGRRLFRDRSTLEISEKCISACANYLVPAAASVELRQGAYIAMHGSAPRGIVEYSQNLARDKGNSTETLRQALRDFPDMRQKYLAPEMQYFSDIVRDDAYITRYREQVRTILVENSIQCKQYGEFLLILDKEYLDAFGITSTGWAVNSAKDFVAALGKKFPHSNIIYGFRGDVTRLLSRPGSNCRSDRASDSGIF